MSELRALVGSRTYYHQDLAVDLLTPRTDTKRQRNQHKDGPAAERLDHAQDLVLCKAILPHRQSM